MTDYPSSLDVRPLTTWPGKLTRPHHRQRSPFSAPLRSTLSILDRELFQLGAEHPVLEVAIEAGQFRLDGRPRSTARAEHPGVVLSLPMTSVGALRYATDLFVTWQDNLRAIALGLEALRKVDRYGITRRGEQYAGFKALPSGIAMPATSAVESMTIEEAARLLASACDTGYDGPSLLASGPTAWRGQYRSAAKTHHPDVGGSRAAWDQVEHAKRVLDEHAGIS
jgi:hypothetical protein